jgi:glutathione S-transferase
MSASSSDLTLHYWKIPGRASLAYLLLKVGGLPVVFVDEDALPEDQQKRYKETSPFGQLPCLTDSANGVVMAQSAAIAAYASRIAHLDGADLHGYAQTLQYIELEQEIMQFCGKALYTGDKGSTERSQAWEIAKTKVWEKLAKVSSALEKKGARFLVDAERPLAADFAVAVIVWFLSSSSLWGSEIFESFPVLSQHYKSVREATVVAAQTFEEMDTWEPYYVI